LILDSSIVRAEFSDTLNRVLYQRQRIVLRRRGRLIAALVPLGDLKRLVQPRSRRRGRRGASEAAAGT